VILIKVAVISDIHGNTESLLEFISYINREDITKVLNLGDIMGGEEPIKTLRIIMKDKRFINVAGNHDDSLTFIEEELTKEELQWLRALPNSRVEIIEEKKFLMVHSRINDNRSIPLLYNEGKIIDFLKDYEGEWEYVLFGHTHFQCYLSFYDGKIMINPGSLGLSYDNKISFAIIEINSKTIDILFKKIDNK